MFVTGASGFLGRHLVLASEAGEWELMAPASRVLDVRERTRVHEEITAWRPNVVAHLAYRRDEWRTIVDGSRNVAVAAAEAGSRLIHLSTDLVFAGRSLPYTEADQPDATQDYGRWKAEAEYEVQAACPSALVVRTSLLYGTDLLAPPQRDVEAVLGGQRYMSFFTDEFRCPAHAADVAAALVRLADMPQVTGVLHIAGPRRQQGGDGPGLRPPVGRRGRGPCAHRQPRRQRPRAARPPRARHGESHRARHHLPRPACGPRLTEGSASDSAR